MSGNKRYHYNSHGLADRLHIVVASHVEPLYRYFLCRSAFSCKLATAKGYKIKWKANRKVIENERNRIRSKEKIKCEGKKEKGVAVACISERVVANLAVARFLERATATSEFTTASSKFG